LNAIENEDEDEEDSSVTLNFNVLSGLIRRGDENAEEHR
jgi:hypothetical protein